MLIKIYNIKVLLSFFLVITILSGCNNSSSFSIDVFNYPHTAEDVSDPQIQYLGQVYTKQWKKSPSKKVISIIVNDKNNERVLVKDKFEVFTDNQLVFPTTWENFETFQIIAKELVEDEKNNKLEEKKLFVLSYYYNEKLDRFLLRKNLLPAFVEIKQSLDL